VTVDLDRDVNTRAPGGGPAGSIDRGAGDRPRFSSSAKGLSVLSGLLDEMALKATFFAEAATLRRVDAGLISGHDVGIHGAEHEDIASIEAADGKRAVLTEAADAVRDALGRPPTCFRAPYMSADAETIRMLPGMGITIDSSRYTAMSPSLMPERLGCGVWEMPVPQGRDASGRRMTAYLWPMHESKREPEDYIRMASEMEEGVFVIATHTWHIVESRERGVMPPEEAGRNTDNVREVIEGIEGLGLRPMTLTEVRKTMEG